MSVIVRVAEANVVPNVATLLKHAIPKAGSAAFTPFTQTRNAAAIGACLGLSTQDTIARMFPVHLDALVSTIDWYGTPLERRFVEAVARRYSPAGFRIAAYGRSVWQIRPLPFCPETFELLHSDCPSCGAVLGWNRTSGIDKCERCDAELDRPTSVLSLEHQEKYRDISGLVDVRPEVRSRSLSQLPQPFCGWEPGHAFTAVVEFGALAATIDQTDVDGVGRELGSGNFSSLGEAGLLLGWDLMRDWPNAFDELVRKMLLNRGHLRMVNKILLPLAKFLRREKYNNTLTAELIRERIPFTLCDINLPFKRIPKSGALKIVRKNSISITEAVTKFGIDRDLLIDAADYGDCLIDPYRGCIHNYLFDKEKLEKAIILKRGGISLSSFARDIGVPTYCVSSFIDFGLVEKISDKNVRAMSRHVLLDPQSVNALLQKLTALALPVCPVSRISISNAMSAELSPLVWAETFAGILSGRLSAFVDGGEGAWSDRIFVERKTLRNHLWQVRSAPLPDVDIAASVGGPIIGFSDIVLGRAIAEGLLKKNSSGIPLCELARFRADYIPPSEISGWFEGSAKFFASLMRNSGAASVATLHKVNIWRRPDVERIFGRQRTRSAWWIKISSEEF